MSYFVYVVFLLFQMAQNMRENLKKINFMAKENIRMQMVIFMKENGDMGNLETK